VEGKFDVAIVGGGLAGLSLAIGLSDRGHTVAVLEARRGVSPVKRGMSLSPNGLKVLDSLHLLHDVEMIGRKVTVVKFLKAPGELLVAYDYSLIEQKQNYLLTILTQELELVLRKRAEGGGVRLYEGASFDSLLRENGEVNGVWATIDGGASNLEAKVVVGADGAKSRVRELAGIRVQTRSYPSSYLVTVAGGAEDSPDDARHYLAKGKMLGNFPLPVGRYLFYYVPAGAFESLKARGLESFKGELTALAPELRGSLETINSWQDLSYMVPQRLNADSWVDNHIALIGDAAHSIEPSLGQGGSLALSDVGALLETLTTCFAKSDFSKNALKSYENSRRPHTEFMQDMAERTAKLMNTNSNLIARFRDRSLRKAQENRKSMILALEMASGMTQNFSIGQKLKLAGVL
jgi:2-polyprenyl-6-methoxyphenol hydroxylase-like FAD-dependent oxidoreductase